MSSKISQRIFNGRGIRYPIWSKIAPTISQPTNVKEYHDDTGEGTSVSSKYPENTDNLQHRRDRFESTMDLPKTTLSATTSSNKISRIPIQR